MVKFGTLVVKWRYHGNYICTSIVTSTFQLSFKTIDCLSNTVNEIGAEIA